MSLQGNEEKVERKALSTIDFESAEADMGIKMKIRRIMIAAPKSGSGKTTVTCALLYALKERGQKVISYKCGPDYIDPMYHEKVIGVPAKNLDTFFTGEEDTRALFLRNAEEGDFAVLEGVMGLYDGLGGVREEGSSYHLAKVTGTPVVLVADVKGMARSVLPLLAGFLAYDREHLIRGVILNRISEGYFKMLKPLIEEELRLPVLGFLKDGKNLYVGSRHLGLVMPDELKDRRERLHAAAEELVKSVSVSALVEIAESAEEIRLKEKRFQLLILSPLKRTWGIKMNRREAPAAETTSDRCPSVFHARNNGSTAEPDGGGRRPVIAVAKDEAFCFYYADNLYLLRENGAEIRYFSPLHDEKLPEGCSGLLLGGGYPELYAKGLSENGAMRMAVKRAVEGGMPVVAECGGFMYLHRAITDGEGISHTMAGVVPAVCFYTGKPVRFGYIEIQEKKCYFLPEGGRIKGHEFHYYDSTDNGDGALALKPVTGRSYPCIREGETYWMGFPHLYYPSNPSFAEAFVKKAGRYEP